MYRGCENCKYEPREAFEEPCINCRNNYVVGTHDYEEHPFLWASAETSVEHPSHYNQGNIECIDAMVAAFGKEAVATFCRINAFKYIWRSEHKNGSEDIEKALWYLTKYMELNDDAE